MSSSRMQPLLGKQGPTSALRTQRMIATVEAVVGIVLLGMAFWFGVHYVHDHAVVNPLFIGLYPFIGVTSLVAFLPFFMFLSFPLEFTRLHPLNPKDYLYLMQRLLGAASQNNLKVTAKEL